MPNRNPAVVGKEVLSHCGRCKLSLAHIVVSLKDAITADKVQCKTCGAMHKYRDPAKVGKVATKKKTTRKKKSSKDQPISDLWMSEMASASSKPKKYNIKEEFAVGDIIDHGQFGAGIVKEIADTNKIEVVFQNDVKILVHCIGKK